MVARSGRGVGDIYITRFQLLERQGIRRVIIIQKMDIIVNSKLTFRHHTKNEVSSKFKFEVAECFGFLDKIYENQKQ